MAKKADVAPAPTPALTAAEVLFIDAATNAVVTRPALVVAPAADGRTTLNVQLLPADGRLSLGGGKGVIGEPCAPVMTLDLFPGDEPGCFRALA